MWGLSHYWKNNAEVHILLFVGYFCYPQPVKNSKFYDKKKKKHRRKVSSIDKNMLTIPFLVKFYVNITFQNT